MIGTIARRGCQNAWFFVYELQNMFLKELKKNDVALALGTDVGPTFLSLVSGFSALDELRLLTENDFSPYEAIATKHAKITDSLVAAYKQGGCDAALRGRNSFQG
jgi:hypothetical protein